MDRLRPNNLTGPAAIGAMSAVGEVVALSGAVCKVAEVFPENPFRDIRKPRRPRRWHWRYFPTAPWLWASHRNVARHCVSPPAAVNPLPCHSPTTIASSSEGRSAKILSLALKEPHAFDHR